MIDEQKLLQWIDRKLEIFAPTDSDTENEALLFLGRRRMLNTLLRDIDNGEFVPDPPQTLNAISYQVNGLHERE